MDNILKELIKIYDTQEIDWMLDKTSKKNPFTYHHIKEDRNGGERTLENGAILTTKSHAFLNYLERTNKPYYKKFNELFQMLNDSKMPPNEEYYNAIRSILNELNTIEEDNKETTKRKKKTIKRRACYK